MIQGALTNVIGRGTWLDKVASQIVEREKQLGRSTALLRVESGLGASGIPHVGSLGDAVRAYGIKLALEDAGLKAELVAYSDDYDGLRKVPEGLPTWLEKHLGAPVALVPDPFGCHASYGQHMSSMLLEALDELRVEYRFQSGAEAYRNGLLNNMIVQILENADKIGKRIAELLGQTKYEEVLPYFPICDSCGRIYVTQAYEYEPKTKRVLYRCVGTELKGRRIQGCGHSGETNVLAGRGKLSWKAEFAARWAAQDIRFEAYGKDLADSVRVNDWVSDEILGFPHPFHVRYELFLDRSGRKISKSIGNVFTPQTWLRYGTPRSLYLLMFKRIAGTRNLSIQDIPNYMDEYDSLEDLYFGRRPEANPNVLRKMKGLYEYVNRLRPAKEPGAHVPYRMLVQLASVAPKEDPVEFVVSRLTSYGLVRKVTPDLNRRVRLALNWVEDFAPPQRRVITLSEGERAGVADLADLLLKVADAAAIQTAIFEIARSRGVPPPDFFKLLYRIFIGSEKGPRLGPYLVDIGPTNAAQALREYLR